MRGEGIRHMNMRYGFVSTHNCITGKKRRYFIHADARTMHRVLRKHIANWSVGIPSVDCWVELMILSILSPIAGGTTRRGCRVLRSLKERSILRRCTEGNKLTISIQLFIVQSPATFCSCQCGIFTVLYANSSVAHSLDNPTSAIISLMNEKNSIFTQQQPSRHPLPQPPLPPLRQLLHRHRQHHHLASPNIHPCHHLIS